MLASQVGVGAPMEGAVEFPGDETAEAVEAKPEGRGSAVAALSCGAGDVAVSAKVLSGVNGVRVAGHKSRPTVGVGELQAADTKIRQSITTQPRARIGEW